MRLSISNEELRELAIALLDDNEGINEKAYKHLQKLLSINKGNEDILNRVDAVDGRYYLPTK